MSECSYERPSKRAKKCMFVEDSEADVSDDEDDSVEDDSNSDSINSFIVESEGTDTESESEILDDVSHKGGVNIMEKGKSCGEQEKTIDELLSSVDPTIYRLIHQLSKAVASVPNERNLKLMLSVRTCLFSVGQLNTN